MSRSFNGTDQWLSRNDRLGFSAYPLSMFGWIKATSVSGSNKAVCGFYEDGGSFANLVKIAVKTDRAVELALFDGSYKTATTTNLVTLNAWQTVAGVFASSASRSVYVNGGGKVTDTTATSLSFAALNRFALGAFVMGAPTEYFAGLMGFVGVWNVALSDANVTALHGGALPSSIAGLVGFYRLKTPGIVTEPDDANDYDLDVNGAVFSTDDPPVGSPAAAAAYYASLLGR
jgi:hypothetical protein